MRIPQAAERLKEAPAQALRAVLSRTPLPKDVPAQQALRAVLSKEAPAQALRAVFSGVGQVLLVTERVRRRAMGDDQDAAAPAAPAAPAAEGAPAVAEAAPAVAEDGTTAAKPGTPKASAPKASTAKTSSSAAKPSTAKASTPKASTPKASTPKAGTTKSTPAKAGSAKTGKAAAPKAPAADPAGTPPIPGYPELSVASLRARMRGLDVAQLRDLISYERAHEDRETVIAMFERRIAKLDAAGPAAG